MVQALQGRASSTVFERESMSVRWQNERSEVQGEIVVL